jgi:hypothetical protein
VKLKPKIEGKAGQGAKGGKASAGRSYSMGGRRGTTGGVVIDGAVYPLEGEPPVVKTNGWGRVPGR